MTKGQGVLCRGTTLQAGFTCPRTYTSKTGADGTILPIQTNGKGAGSSKTHWCISKLVALLKQDGGLVMDRMQKQLGGPISMSSGDHINLGGGIAK
jgi:hypothetical protein